jgi:hypothetical protein
MRSIRPLVCVHPFHPAAGGIAASSTSYSACNSLIECTRECGQHSVALPTLDWHAPSLASIGIVRLVARLRSVAASRPPFPRPRRIWRRTTSARGRACIWCPHSRAAARPGCPRPGTYHRRHRTAGTTIAPAYGLPLGELPDGLPGSSLPGRTSPVRGRVPCSPGYSATGPFQSPFGPLGPRTHGSRHVGGKSPWRRTTSGAAPCRSQCG